MCRLCRYDKTGKPINAGTVIERGRRGQAMKITDIRSAPLRGERPATGWEGGREQRLGDILGKRRGRSLRLLSQRPINTIARWPRATCLPG